MNEWTSLVSAIRRSDRKAAGIHQAQSTFSSSVFLAQATFGANEVVVEMRDTNYGHRNSIYANALAFSVLHKRTFSFYYAMTQFGRVDTTSVRLSMNE